MLAILALLLLTSGLQVGDQMPAIVTGVVLSADGKPAAGIRVYAMPAGGPDGTGPTTFESLAQTDETGRYRLEVLPGRHYIAAGSVQSPTYYPGTAELKSARIFTVAAGMFVRDIDFSRFVPPPPPPPAPPVRGTNALAGTIRYPDGTPAPGIPVIAVPVNSPLSGTGSGFIVPGLPTTPFTDSMGRYWATRLPDGIYNIVAGWADSPLFYPGTSARESATPLAVDRGGALNALNFTMPWPSPGVTITGSVNTSVKVPGFVAEVVLRPVRPTAAEAPGLGLLPVRPARQTNARGDGSFEFRDVLPGAYSIEARGYGFYPVTQDLVVTDQPVTDLRMSFPIAEIFGTVTWDGMAPLGDVAVTTTSASGFSTRTFIETSTTGAFQAFIEAGKYRVDFRKLPEGYVIQSITAAGLDLMKEPLELTEGSRAAIEIRLARITP